MFGDEEAELHLRIAECLQCWQLLKLMCLPESPLLQMYGLRCASALPHGAMFRDFFVHTVTVLKSKVVYNVNRKPV